MAGPCSKVGALGLIPSSVGGQWRVLTGAGPDSHFQRSTLLLGVRVGGIWLGGDGSERWVASVWVRMIRTEWGSSSVGHKGEGRVCTVGHGVPSALVVRWALLVCFQLLTWTKLFQLGLCSCHSLCQKCASSPCPRALPSCPLVSPQLSAPRSLPPGSLPDPH